jgi:hypothetical protein
MLGVYNVVILKNALSWGGTEQQLCRYMSIAIRRNRKSRRYDFGRELTKSRCLIRTRDGSTPVPPFSQLIKLIKGA